MIRKNCVGANSFAHNQMGVRMNSHLQKWHDPCHRSHAPAWECSRVPLQRRGFTRNFCPGTGQSVHRGVPTEAWETRLNKFILAFMPMRRVASPAQEYAL